jgi:ATP-dependent Clp endopeptidase proteolytic subunit ClpP
MATRAKAPDAQSQYLTAATNASKAEAAKLRAEAKNLELEGRGLERNEAPFVERLMVFSGEVGEVEVSDSIDRLLDFEFASHEPITILLNSPGGDVFDGLLLFDTLQDIRRKGVHVTVKVRGLAASMGSILSQAGDTRVISRNSWFMIHEPSTIVFGKAGDIKREADLMVKLHKQLSAVLAERSNLTAAEVIRKSTDKDWWLPAIEAKGLGFFDELA